MSVKPISKPTVLGLSNLSFLCNSSRLINWPSCYQWVSLEFRNIISMRSVTDLYFFPRIGIICLLGRNDAKEEFPSVFRTYLLHRRTELLLIPHSTCTYDVYTGPITAKSNMVKARSQTNILCWEFQRASIITRRNTRYTLLLIDTLFIAIQINIKILNLS